MRTVWCPRRFCYALGIKRSDNVKGLECLPASPDRQPIRSPDHLEQVVIVHELDQGADWEFIEQLVR